MLYTGVTSDIARRAWQHRTGAIAGFTTRYKCTRFVLAERHDDIRVAIAREKVIKTWRRAWKTDLIAQANPEWRDLYDLVAAGT